VTELSVVIVNFDSGDYLARCLRSLRADNLREIVVVDNASADGSLETTRLAASGDPRLRIIRNDRNLGFAAACNTGYRQTHGEYVLFLNPDCEVLPGAVEAVCAVLDRNPKAGMAGALLLNPDGSEQRGARRRIPTLGRVLARMLQFDRLRASGYSYGFEQHIEPLPRQPIAVEAISGAFMCVRRAAIDQVGLLDEGYFMHAEDLDWCLRFRQSGWEIQFVPQARVIHAKGACSRKRQLAVHWHMHRGMQRFYLKFFAPNHVRWLQGVVLLGIWLRFMALCPWALLRAVRYRTGLRIA
jgi:GT2 family glycosyltransferase